MGGSSGGAFCVTSTTTMLVVQLAGVGVDAQKRVERGPVPRLLRLMPFSRDLGSRSSLRASHRSASMQSPHTQRSAVGSEWIQEFDSLEEAVAFRFHNGGVLVKRERVAGQPGLWWVEVDEHNLTISRRQSR